jgi:hypothetical protein
MRGIRAFTCSQCGDGGTSCGSQGLNFAALAMNNKQRVYPELVGGGGEGKDSREVYDSRHSLRAATSRCGSGRPFRCLENVRMGELTEDGCIRRVLRWGVPGRRVKVKGKQASVWLACSFRRSSESVQTLSIPVRVPQPYFLPSLAQAGRFKVCRP